MQAECPRIKPQVTALVVLPSDRKEVLRRAPRCAGVGRRFSSQPVVRQPKSLPPSMPGLFFLPFLAVRSASFHLSFNMSLQPILALAAGVLILIRPKLLNFIVAAYLIIVGLIGVFGLRW
jgi:hypothetical protein